MALTINEKLIKACSKNNIDSIKSLLKSNADVNYYNGAPLLIATRKKYTNVMKLLLKNNADVNIDDDEVFKSFATTIFSETSKSFVTNHKILKLLLDNGSNIDAGDGYALYHNVMYNNIRTVEFLLNEGANTKLCYCFETPINNDDEKTAKLLIDHQANINYDALCDSFKMKSTNVFHLLLDAGNFIKDNMIQMNNFLIPCGEMIQYLLTEGYELSSAYENFPCDFLIFDKYISFPVFFGNVFGSDHIINGDAFYFIREPDIC